MNIRRIIAICATLAVFVVLLAFTGCSANTPERNQGNRNGQRVADAVHGRPDSYTGERITRSFWGRNHNRRNADTTFQRGVNTDRPAVLDNVDNANDVVRGDRYPLNRTTRGISRADRANCDVNGICLANDGTVPVFAVDNHTAITFQKKSNEAAPATPETTPETTAPTSMAYEYDYYNDYYDYSEYDTEYNEYTDYTDYTPAYYYPEPATGGRVMK